MTPTRAQAIAFDFIISPPRSISGGKPASTAVNSGQLPSTLGSFFDFRATALANVLAALPFGIATFDASAGGLGGCPYAPGAAGNLATDDLVYMLNGLGVETGVSLPALSGASAFMASRLDHRLPSRYAQAMASVARGT